MLPRGPALTATSLGLAWWGRADVSPTERAAEGQGQRRRVLPLWETGFKKTSVSSDFFSSPVGLLFLLCLHMFFGLLVGRFPDGIPQVVGEGIGLVSY